MLWNVGTCTNQRHHAPTFQKTDHFSLRCCFDALDFFPPTSHLGLLSQLRFANRRRESGSVAPVKGRRRVQRTARKCASSSPAFCFFFPAPLALSLQKKEMLCGGFDPRVMLLRILLVCGSVQPDTEQSMMWLLWQYLTLWLHRMLSEKCRLEHWLNRATLSL